MIQRWAKGKRGSGRKEGGMMDFTNIPCCEAEIHGYFAM